MPRIIRSNSAKKNGYYALRPISSQDFRFFGQELGFFGRKKLLKIQKIGTARIPGLFG